MALRSAEAAVRAGRALNDGDGCGDPGGVVFHTGRRRRQIDRDIEAVPIAALWGRRGAPEVT